MVLATKNTASKNMHKKVLKKHTLIVSPHGTAPCTDRLIFNVVVQVFLQPLPPALRKTVTPALRKTVTPALRKTVTPAQMKTVTPAQPPSREKLKEMKRLVGISVKYALQ